MISSQEKWKLIEITRGQVSVIVVQEGKIVLNV
jgi:hypothetical protein